MTLMGICRDCVEEAPAGRPPERRYLKSGPNGRKLCSSHAKEAWNDYHRDTGTDPIDESNGDDTDE